MLWGYFMFCEKCGNEIIEGNKFCTKCGAPVPSNQQPVQAVTEPAPAVDNQAEVNTEAVTEQNVQEAQESAQQQPVIPTTPPQSPDYNANSQQIPTAPVAAAPKPPKKPMSKKAKMAIIFSSIGAGVLAIVLVLLFVLIIPRANKIDLQDYIKVEFDEKNQYEGHASAIVSIDYEDIVDKYEKNSSIYYKVYDIIKHCKISAQIIKADNSTPDSIAAAQNDISYYDAATSCKVYNISSNDTIEVTLSWDKGEDALKEIKRDEKSAKISFDKSDKTFNISVEKELEKDLITLNEAVDVDLFGYIEDNNLFKTVGTKNKLSLKLSDFSFEQGGYTFTCSEDNYGKLVITDSDNKEVGYTYINYYLEPEKVKPGENIEISIYNENISDTNIFFNETKKNIVIPDYVPVTADNAKGNLDILKKKFKELTSYYKNVQIIDIYFLEGTKSDSKYENGICFTYSYKASFGDSTYYNSITFLNCYYDNDELKYETYDSGWSSSKKAEMEKDNKWLSEYKKTKIN